LQSDAFKEINLGEWEGKTQEVIKEENPIQFEFFCISPDVQSIGQRNICRCSEAGIGKTE
jgi:broad specificity phosphatase PhoE